MNMESITYMEKVLFNEVNNLKDIYLYLEGGLWCAYERSAYFLERLKVPVEIKVEIVRDGFDVILLKASIPANEGNLPIASAMQLENFDETDLHFKLCDGIEGFPEWKVSQINAFSALA